MPNIKSAKKRVLVNQKKNQEKRILRSEMNTAIKKFNFAVDTNNIAEAEALLPETISIIDSMVTKGIIHKNNADNKKASLSKRLSDVKSGKVVINIKKDNKTIAAEKAKAAQEAREAIKAENNRKKEEARIAKEKADTEKAEAEKAAKKVSRKKTTTAAKEEKPVKAEKKTEKKATKKTEKTEKTEK